MLLRKQWGGKVAGCVQSTGNKTLTLERGLFFLLQSSLSNQKVLLQHVLLYVHGNHHELF